MGRTDEFHQRALKLNAWNRFVLKGTTALHQLIRSHFANRYLAGAGIEIGAQHLPLKVTNGKTIVKYVDRCPKEVNAALYNLPLEMIVEPDYYLEAEDLNAFADRSLDFVIANHVLEHMEDPVGALVEWLRVLRDGGILFLTVPNHLANEYDFRRVPVSSDHLISIYKMTETPARWAHKLQHWREFVTAVDDIPLDDPAFEPRLRHYTDRDDRIHFHVFDFELLMRALDYINSSLGEILGSGVEILDTFHLQYGYDLLLVIRKRSASQHRSGGLNHPTRSARDVTVLINFACQMILRKIRRRKAE
jgi:SAM-dependent methyltransferase